MNSLLYFLAGLFLGILAWNYTRKKAKSETSKLNDQKIRLQQEKEIIVDFMHNLAVAIGEGVVRKDLYQRIAHTAVMTTGAISACVYEKLANGKLQSVATEGLFPPQRKLRSPLAETSTTRARFLEKILASEILEDGEGIIGEVAKTGKAVYVPQAQNDPRVVKHDDPSLMLRSLIYSPLLHDDQISGVLVVANPANGLPFSETDFSLVNSLAEQAALAIKNSDAMNLRVEKTRMDSDLTLARDVQELFLAKESPDFKGLEIDTQYVPSSQVSGDFYDFYKLSASKFAVSVADVSGKGVPASLLMALCQTNLRHYVNKSKSPREILIKLNQDLEERIREDMFITLFLAIIDTQANTITFSRAGHEPALLGKVNNDHLKVEKLRGNGMALGMVPSDLFEEVIEDQTCAFEHGDMLVLYTDGVTESQNQSKEEFGLDRLCEKLEGAKEKSPRSFNSSLMSSLEAFSSTSSDRDDLTLLTVKRT
jgi:sigma-B regulation protein RsbU (phosphoserine phosphatase)|tara:strand:+ start:482 stop:1924 length:1443 start_codon:yes stop_codon:yes gene_type:complete